MTIKIQVLIIIIHIHYIHIENGIWMPIFIIETWFQVHLFLSIAKTKLVVYLREIIAIGTTLGGAFFLNSFGF